MYRIAICDDEKTFLEMAQEQIQEYCRSNEIGVVIKKYASAVTLAEDIEAGKMFDAYILDIEMKNYSGLEIARMVKNHSSTACIIFLTSYSSYAVEACGMQVFRYVLKEKMEKKLPEVLDALFRHLKFLENNDIYVIWSQRKYVKLAQRSIIYIRKDKKNAVFMLTDGQMESERITLQDVYRKLNPKEMIFLDRGIIVNVFHVQKILKNQIRMTEGHTVTTSKNGIMELKQFLNRYWGEIL